MNLKERLDEILEEIEIAVGSEEAVEENPPTPGLSLKELGKMTGVSERDLGDF